MKRLALVITPTAYGVLVTTPGYDLTFPDILRLRAKLQSFPNICGVERAGDNSVAVHAFGNKERIAAKLRARLTVYGSISIDAHITSSFEGDWRWYEVAITLREKVDRQRFIADLIVINLDELRSVQAQLIPGADIKIRVRVPQWLHIDWRDELTSLPQVPLYVVNLTYERYSPLSE